MGLSFPTYKMEELDESRVRLVPSFPDEVLPLVPPMSYATWGCPPNYSPFASHCVLLPGILIFVTFWPALERNRQGASPHSL